MKSSVANDFDRTPTDEATRPPATFFTINAVLAKLDRQRGRGPNAVRFAALDAFQRRDRCAAPRTEAPPAGNEPFGLFTFRAPEGMLWRKWRGIEADMAKEHAFWINAGPS